MSSTRFTKQPSSVGRQSLWNEYKTCVSDSISEDCRKTKLHNTAADQRKKIIEKGRHFLLYSSSDGRLSREIREVIETNLELNKKWEPVDGEVALEALEKYALNILRYPWKKELQTIKTYSGFFKARVQSRLINASVLLSQIGYEQNGDHSFVMKPRASSSSLQLIAFEMFLGCQECWILRQIFDRVYERGYSVQQVYKSREENTGNIESYVKVLLEFFVPVMKPITAGSSDSDKNHDESDNGGVQNLKNDSPEFLYNRTDTKPSKLDFSKPGILPRYATSKLSSSDPVPGLSSSVVSRSNTFSHAVHPVSVHGLARASCDTNNSDLFKPRSHDDIIAKSHQIVHEIGAENIIQSKPGLSYPKSQATVNNSSSEKGEVNSKIVGNPHIPGTWRISGNTRKRPANGLKDDEQQRYSELQTHRQLPLGGDFYEVIGDKKPLLPHEKDSTKKVTGENNVVADRRDRTSPTTPNIGLGPTGPITSASRGGYPPSFADSEKLNTLLQDIQNDAKSNNKKDINFSTFGKEEQVANANRRSVYDNCPETDIVADCSELSPTILDVRPEMLAGSVRSAHEYKHCSSEQENHQSLPLFESSRRELRSTAHTAPLRKPVEQGLPPNSTVSPYWQCQECTYCNAMRDSVCASCFKSRFKKSEKIPLKSGGPQCARCTFVNSEKAEECGACGSVLKGCPTYI